MNENYEMPAMPEGAEEGILRGIYRFQASTLKKPKAHGAAVRQRRDPARGRSRRRRCSRSTASPADVWSVTSYNELRRDARRCERWNMLHPGETPKALVRGSERSTARRASVVAASDYMKVVPEASIATWRRPMIVARHRRLRPQREPRGPPRLLRGRCRHVVAATLSLLAREKQIDVKVAQAAFKDLGINPDKANPATV